MKILFEEIEGRLDPKWLLAEVRSEETVSYYSVEGPFERLLPEDLHDAKMMTVSMGDLLVPPETKNIFGIPAARIAADSPEMDLHELDYFILLVDDIQELLHLQPNYFRTS
ncbi:hypothetical protein [Alkalicoccus daliensis]|uniref:Uncharacterized protein n=1 Tax=Alkalicoccus daliensis TaxID=745820 RepID=A0A1H0HJD1_9BACI|nr:hypothetical protein [Alkalicoccus daliensis]SDO19210.1 hypothetical protein SAMN04488053_108125 [Alkalicoccus daliensis]